MAERKCSCGAVIPPRNGPGKPRSKCVRCAPPRNRAARVSAPVVELGAAAAPVSTGVVAAVRAELEAAGRLDCAAGALAVSLAEQLQAGGQSGASAAALSREIRAAVESALKEAKPAGDALDELRERRAQRRGA